MKVMVLGAGLQGCAAAFDLLSTSRADVSLVDRVLPSLPSFLEPFRGARLSVSAVDAGDRAALHRAIAGHQAVLSALPYYLNVEAAAAAIAAGAHFADLGGNTDVVRRQQAMHVEAVRCGISVVPDCGVAPGLVNVLAAHGLERVGGARSVRLYVGGLPQHPVPPLNYTIVYSLEGVLDYYTTPSWILRDGRLAEVEALSEVEELTFESLGRLEAFHTAGGASTMPFELEGRVETLEYKTLRYPGHADIMRAIRALGLLDTTAVDVRGQQVSPRDLFIAVADRTLRRSDPDLIVLRVIVGGAGPGAPGREPASGDAQQVVYDVLDRFDESLGISAMMRTTAYSLSITAQLQLDGKIEPGVKPAYQATPYLLYIDALRRRGIVVRERWEPGSG